MQYPIIDNLIYAYQRNGWTGLELTEGKNLFGGRLLKDKLLEVAYQPVINETNKTITITHSAEGPAGYSRVLYNLDSTKVYTLILTANLTRTGRNNSLLFTYLDNTYQQIVVESEEKQTFRFVTDGTKQIRDFSFSFYSDVPLTIYYDESGLFEGDIDISDFEPYAPPTTDIKNRMKLPMIHYFPHPVIDAIISAADGQQTAEENEILRHYLTPLGIGGI